MRWWLRRLMEPRAPVLIVRCPVHGQLVCFDGEGRCLWVCKACEHEAVIARIALERRAAR